MGFFQDAWRSQFQNINKAKGESSPKEDAEGVVNDPIDELALDMTDEELIDLRDEWDKTWNGSAFKKEWQAKCDRNDEYWKGEQDKESGERKLQDNVIFESEETLLPIAGRQNPEPVVYADDTPEGEAISDKVKKMLVFQSDRLTLKTKGKRVLRHWSTSYIGAVKIGWNMEENDIDLVVVRPKTLVLDPDCVIESGRYYGGYIGQILSDSARNLIQRFPDKAEEITKKVDGKMGTKLQYGEWWTPKYMFWTFEKIVLSKAKNPHWNYDGQETRTDEYGNEAVEEVKGRNHFPVPRMPFVFFTVFNTGLHPMDDTSLIEQNIPKQDLVNKRLRQIDKNADNTNNGLVVNGQAFTDDQATEAANAIRKGAAIRVPGDVNSSIKRLEGAPLPNFIYDQLVDTRTAIRANFGVLGSSPQGISSEQTVRGKIIVKTQDTDRVALIVEALEQFYDQIFNWFVQMFYVYYDEEHAASVLGEQAAREYITLKSADLNRKLLVSVKEGSLLPKDELSRRNEAIDLWNANALDPITLYSRLGFADPKGTAMQLFLWQKDPYQYFGLPNPMAAMPPQMPQTHPTEQAPTADVGMPQPAPEQNILNQVPTQ